jgi:hypothetical protein
VVVRPRLTAVLSEMVASAPTQRDRRLQSIAEHRRIGSQRRSRYNHRALVEASISRLKRVMGDALRLRTDWRRATEVAIAVHALNRMLELGRPKSVRLAWMGVWRHSMCAKSDPCNKALTGSRQAAAGECQIPSLCGKDLPIYLPCSVLQARRDHKEDLSLH